MRVAGIMFLTWLVIVALRLTGVIGGVVVEIGALGLLIGAVTKAVRAGRNRERTLEDHTEADRLVEQRMLDEKERMR